MKRLPAYLVAFIALFLISSPGCSKYWEARKTAEEEEIREIVFRELLRRAKPDQVCFLSFGRVEEVALDDPRNDPSDEFLSRLYDLNSEIRKVSECEGGFGGVFLKGTLHRGSIFTVKIERWIRWNKVEVSARRWTGPVSAHGFSCIVKKKDGQWFIAKRYGGWFS